jgi:NADPH-dependent ferric siderophore reductase
MDITEYHPLSHGYQRISLKYQTISTTITEYHPISPNISRVSHEYHRIQPNITWISPIITRISPNITWISHGSSQVKLILFPKQRAKPAASRTRTCTNAAVCIASGECLDITEYHPVSHGYQRISLKYQIISTTITEYHQISPNITRILPNIT